MADYTTTGIVTAPVDLKGVADLLNSSGSGTPAWPDDESVCTSGRINPFSRFKPIRDEAIVFDENTDAIWKAHDWGYWIPSEKSSLAIAKWINGDTLPWTSKEIPDEDDCVFVINSTLWAYLKPRGDSVSPAEIFRQGDFRKYDHTTGRPLTSATLLGMNVIGADGSKTLPVGQKTSDVVMCSKFDGATFNLGSRIYEYSDFASICDKYFGVLVVNTTTPSSSKYITAAKNLSETEDTENKLYVDKIIINKNHDLSYLSTLFSDTSMMYKVYPIVCTEAHTSPTSVSSDANMIPLPFDWFYMQRHLANAIIECTAVGYDPSGTSGEHKVPAIVVTFKNTGYSDATNLSVTFTFDGGRTRTVSPTSGSVVSKGGTLSYTVSSLTWTTEFTDGETVDISFTYSDSETGGNGSATCTLYYVAPRS